MLSENEIIIGLSTIIVFGVGAQWIGRREGDIACPTKGADLGVLLGHAIDEHVVDPDGELGKAFEAVDA